MAFRASSSRKTYVVFKGRKPGFYSTWSECQVQVNGFSGALYQGFNSREEAESAWIRFWSIEYMNAGGGGGGYLREMGEIGEVGNNALVERNDGPQGAMGFVRNSPILFSIYALACLCVLVIVNRGGV
ncbi:Ribosomal protein L9/RNase H1, N-terminal [Sesbania bispinosa]|nr:Ribosomal protein L9/RNase H1, N-terminal [Sesbania bispinosa]